MDLSNIEDLKVAMQLAGLRTRKGLGQHFLVDRESLNKMLEAGELDPGDTVLEIGPGLGVMTQPLAKQVKRVLAVETDSELVKILQRATPENVEIIAEDILNYDLRPLPKGYKVVANIPYYLTSQIFRLFLESSNQPASLALLVQKEVAQRVTAEPGQMSILAFSVQYYGKPELLEIVERHKFWPPPKVDSAILRVRVYDRPVFDADREKLFRLVKAGFGEKRKMLKNSLAGGLNITIDLAADIIEMAELAPTARAQELSMRDWKRLYGYADDASIL